ncbi:hypothetical protein DFQ26_009725 [Actinomortierella ambigua]|nr:hypothetical protein DFQ26_009725 [Actinomortierella ambigua]
MADSAANPVETVVDQPAAPSIPADKGRELQDETIDNDHAKELDDDELFEELENDDFGLASLREQRMEELKEEIERRTMMVENDHDQYKEVTVEKELMETTTKTKCCVIHFYHSDFRRCMIVDRHLETLAKKHYKTKFMKIKVENAPFLVEKLQVQVLPCVMSFVDGSAVDKMVGFEELGNTDNFSTSMLEMRLKRAGVVEDEAKKEAKKKNKKSIFGGTRGDDSSDEGTDDDDY